MRAPARPLAISVMYSLESEQGHILSYNLTFGEAVQSMGWDHRATVRAAARVAELPAGWTRDLGSGKYVFRRNPWQRIERVGRLMTTLAAYLRRTIAHEPRPIVLLLEWFHVVHLMAFCGSLLAVPRRRQLHAWFLYRFDFTNRWDRSLHLGLHWLLRRLLGREHIVLFTEADSVAAKLSGIFGQTVHLLPMPQMLQPHEHRVRPAWADSPERRGKLVCWWAGVPSVDKGQAVIECLIGLTTPEAGQVCIVADQRMGRVAPKGGCKVILLPDTLNRAEYAGWLDTMDMALLPYSPVIYANRTSGVFADSVCMGRLPVVTDGTWMARELRRYQLDDLIVDWDRPDIFAELLRLARDNEVRQKLGRLSADYQDLHSVAGYARALRNIVDQHLPKELSKGTT